MNLMNYYLRRRWFVAWLMFTEAISYYELAVVGRSHLVLLRIYTYPFGQAYLSPSPFVDTVTGTPYMCLWWFNTPFHEWWWQSPFEFASSAASGGHPLLSLIKRSEGRKGMTFSKENLSPSLLSPYGHPLNFTFRRQSVFHKLPLA